MRVVLTNFTTCFSALVYTRSPSGSRFPSACGGSGTSQRSRSIHHAYLVRQTSFRAPLSNKATNHSNETNSNLPFVSRPHLCCDRIRTGHKKRRGREPHCWRRSLCTSRTASFGGGWHSIESLLHGERLAHRRLRFRMGRLGASVVEGAARGRQIHARLQL